MEFIFFIALLWGGFICGIIYGRAKDEENAEEKQERHPAKTSFRSPLVRYE